MCSVDALEDRGGGEEPVSAGQFVVAMGRWASGIVRTLRSLGAPHEDEITAALAQRAREYFGDRVQVKVESNVISLESDARGEMITPALTLRTYRGSEGMERLLRGFGAILRDWPEPPPRLGARGSQDDYGVGIDVGEETVTVWWLDGNGSRVAIEPLVRAATGL
jgi:hypothetical protein